eukprot:CAMPEP_0170509340 /NCGR_PEP_ID=MMETSP0208-20121228/65159_1 /TAXON_ID=197538 /ORGANISM="Strombidium inclinatum, Strain S3" /LENGTH=57 /DNA_ID=CAMNT_0010792693 /DNA_START=1340 /DNA_END=1513 /DNA_ORIENTATION=-
MDESEPEEDSQEEAAEPQYATPGPRKQVDFTPSLPPIPEVGPDEPQKGTLFRSQRPI